MGVYRPRSPRTAQALVRCQALVAGTSLMAFVAVTLVVALSTWPHGMDRWVERWVVGSRIEPLTIIADAFTWLGSGLGLLIAVLVFGGVLWWRTRRWLVPALLAATVVAAAGVETVVKFVVARARPPAGLVLGTPALTAAFPSGHTTNGTVTYLTAMLLLAGTLRWRTARRLSMAVAVALGAGIGWSRVYLGYHWCTDVIGGWLLATCVVAGSSAAATAWTMFADGPVSAAIAAGASYNRLLAQSPPRPYPPRLAPPGGHARHDGLG